MVRENRLLIMKDWSRFRIQTKEPLPIETGLLEQVHHIVHLRISRRILEDEQIRAGLIHDESKLNKSRLCVAWLSANYWHNGSIYGTVRLTFDWNQIIEGSSLYWVEDMNYPNPAYRLLITDRDLTASKKVVPYDPIADDGPVRLRGGRWLWNAKYTSEFMVERDLPLAEAKAISFVNHSRCRERRGCPEEDIHPNAAGAQTFAFLLGNGIHCVDHLLKDEKALNSEADTCVNQLWRSLGRKEEFFGGALSKSKSTEDVLLGALALLGSGQVAAAKETLKTFKNQEVFTAALTALIRKHFELPDWEIQD
jgi:hypothetical protein